MPNFQGDEDSDMDRNPFCAPQVSPIGSLRRDGFFKRAFLVLQPAFPCLERRAVQAAIRAAVVYTDTGDAVADYDALYRQVWDQVVAYTQAELAAPAVCRDAESIRQAETSALWGELRELHEIMLRTVRRCARDLNHAIDNIPDKDTAEMFRERYRLYATAFADLRDYRLQLHSDLSNAERRLAQHDSDIREMLAELRELKAERARNADHAGGGAVEAGPAVG